jgi:condensin complex subunit 2
MGKLIKEESSQERGVNFQKASCTLDASVKIYSHRVDDTHASSHRILESLSRNGTHEDDDGVEPGSAKVGTKASSNRHNIADTIERNLENINSAVVEKVQTADPMFHKMSKAFDEGGAKGMLMVNLRMAPNSSTLRFNLETISKEAEVQSSITEGSVTVPSTEMIVEQQPIVESSSSSSSMIDISTLILKSGFTYTDLEKMTICPHLDEYRKTLDIIDSDAGIVTNEFVSEQASLVASSEPYAKSSSSPEQQMDEPIVDYGDDDNGCGFECYDDNGDDNQVISPQEKRKSTPSRRLSGAPKLDWDDIPQTRVPFGEYQPDVPEEQQIEPTVEAVAGITASNEYNFFDMNMISKTNAWAGARHWKFATRMSSRLANKDESNNNQNVAEENKNDDDNNNTEKSKTQQKSINKKEKSKIDFFDEWVSEECFATPSGKSDTTVMTNAAILKNETASEEGALFLPPDAKLEIRDLCRLFLCNRILVPPTNMENILASKAKNLRQQRFQGIISSSSVGQADIVWGSKENQKDTNAGFMRPVVAQSNYDYGDDDDNDYGEYGNASYDQYDESEIPATTQEESNGLAINTNNLIQATRKVEKVNIGYATVAKRVNVKKLKTDIWSKIDVECVSPTNENINPNEKEKKVTDNNTNKTVNQVEKMSFKNMVTDMSVNQEQKEVSLSFYFICLLHLANEKTLTIKGTQGMDDLIISKDI